MSAQGPPGRTGAGTELSSLAERGRGEVQAQRTAEGPCGKGGWVAVRGPLRLRSWSWWAGLVVCTLMAPSCFADGDSPAAGRAPGPVCLLAHRALKTLASAVPSSINSHPAHPCPVSLLWPPEPSCVASYSPWLGPSLGLDFPSWSMRVEDLWHLSHHRDIGEQTRTSGL